MRRTRSLPARSLLALVLTLGLLVTMVGQVFAAAPEGYVEVALTNGGFELGDDTGWSFNQTISQMQGQAWAEGPDAQGFTADSDPLFDDIYGKPNGMQMPNMQGIPGNPKLTQTGCAVMPLFIDDYSPDLKYIYEGKYTIAMISASILSAYGTNHCPSAAYAFSAKAGDLLSFAWAPVVASMDQEGKPAPGIWAYSDTFALVINTDTGAIQQLFHEYVPGVDIGEEPTFPWSDFIGEISPNVCAASTCNLQFVLINGVYNPLNMGNIIQGVTLLDNLQLFSKLPTAEAKPADVHVVITSNPNHAAAAGDVVTYTITVFNNGEGGAKNATVYLPINPDAAEVLDASFDDPDAWVSEVGEDGLIFKTGPLGSKDGTVVATIRLRVKANAPLWTLLTERALAEWTDWADDGSTLSNQPSVQVAPANDARESYTLVVEPGTDGHILFSSTIFAPGEPVGVWYNTPEGAVVAGPTYYAEEDGSLAVDFNSTDLPAGNYSMVFYGHWTEFTVVGAFRK